MTTAPLHLHSAMRRLLDDKRVVATIARHGEGFIAEVKRRPDCELWTVTRANRDALPGQLVERLAPRRREA